MPKYIMWIPIHACGKFILESETPLTDGEVREKILEEGEPVGSFCWQCSKDIETEWTPIEETDLKDLDVFPEK